MAAFNELQHYTAQVKAFRRLFIYSLIVGLAVLVSHVRCYTFSKMGCNPSGVLLLLSFNLILYMSCVHVSIPDLWIDELSFAIDLCVNITWTCVGLLLNVHVG